ncbi:hypothetical protein AB0B50_39145 [Streptomyces sp. NPDC041068]|uniref:hypothetical protein n=1 Tax=Streptomyces sp. NPDC041068 TaxID=3155130 RepID=UPI0033CA1631
MKMAKAAAGVVGVALALGVASPALAAPSPSEDNQLVDSNTVSKNEVKNPLKDINIKVIADAVAKAADKLATKNDLASKTNALQGAKVGR